jgi:hypothetical protein
MNLYKGRKVYHKTLGPVLIQFTRANQRTVAVKLIRDRTETVTLVDDYGNVLELSPELNELNLSSPGGWYKEPAIDRLYYVEPKSLLSWKEKDLTPVQRKIKSLWRESNWVKNNPQLKY